VPASTSPATATPARPTTVAPTTSAAPTTTEAPTTSAAPTTTTSPTTSDEATPTGDPVAFVQNYYSLLPANTDAAWTLLGPTAQRQSGNRGGFDSFYGGLARVWAENLRVNGNRVTATIVFTEKDGDVTREPYQFLLGTQNGREVIESFNRV
jgi:hypothetical protein